MPCPQAGGRSPSRRTRRSGRFCLDALRSLPVLLLLALAAAPVHAQQQEKDPHLSHRINPDVVYEDEGKLHLSLSPKDRPANSYGHDGKTEYFFEVGAAGSTASTSDFTVGNIATSFRGIAKQISSYTIPLTPVADAIAEGEETIVIGVDVRPCRTYQTCEARQYDGQVTVKIRDGPLPKVSLPKTSLTVTEGGTASYGVKLTSDPGAAVTVTVTSAEGGLVKVSGPGGSPGATATLSFTGGASGNWNTARTVTVTAPVDFDSADEQVGLSHHLDGVGGLRPLQSDPELTVSVRDSTAGILVSKSALTLNEGGAEGTYELSLFGDPKAVVDVAVSIPDAHKNSLEVYISGSGPTANWGQTASFRFIGSNSREHQNWEDPQTVRLRARTDANILDDAIVVSHVSTTTDPTTFPHAGNGPGVKVTARDLGGGALTLSTTALSLDEGAEGSYTAKMASNPGGEVTVTVAVPAGHQDAATVQGPGGTAGAGATLTFDAGNWSKAQTVKVKALYDGADLADESFSLTHAAGGFRWLNNVAPAVSVAIDDAGVGLAVSAIAYKPEELLPGFLREGSSATYTVNLASDPGGTVTVTPSSSHPGSLTVSPASHSFDSGNWNRPKTFTLNAVQEVNATDEKVTVSHAVTGYGGVTSGPAVKVNLSDDDLAVTANLTLRLTGKASGREPAYSGFDETRDGAALPRHRVRSS